MLMAESGWGWPRGFPRLPLHSTRNFVSGGPATAEISGGKVYKKTFFSIVQNIYKRKVLLF